MGQNIACGSSGSRLFNTLFGLRRARKNITRSSARPKAAPLQALGNYVSHQRANRFEDEDEYEWAGGCAYSSDSASPPAA
jgi:hypothetical protein